MKVTIITACYNADDFISDCLKSVAGQTFPNIEHLIIDGASTDHTLKIIEKERSQQVVLHSSPDDGIYFALNRGIERATGDIIGFLHADDAFAHSDVIATVVATLEAHPEAMACYGDLVYVRRDDPTTIVRHWTSEPFKEGSFRAGWMPPHPTFFARSEVYQKLEPFDTNLSIGADWEFLLRFFEVERLPSIYVPETWTTMRLGGLSNRSLPGVIRNNLETWKFCLRHFGFFGGLLFPLRKFLHRIRQFRR